MNISPRPTARFVWELFSRFLTGYQQVLASLALRSRPGDVMDTEGNSEGGAITAGMSTVEDRSGSYITFVEARGLNRSALVVQELRSAAAG
jgi:hypothetical protein